ncbi:MAG: alpha-mannosidase [Promethearchaeota archaeon]
MDYELTDKIGYYSGNKRLNTSGFDEPRFDNEKTLEKWLGGKKEIKIGKKLNRYLNKISKIVDPNKIQVHIIGQSHIDCAWMWRAEQTRKKAQVTFSKAILHSDMFPNTFHFALSEPLLLEWIKQDNLELFNQIKDKVRKGNIELVGGSYVEPDCMMPSGEAMIRQRLYGMRFYRENFNILPFVEWFLDSFGYNYGLPQILAKSGAKYFWTSKLTWNKNTIFPFVNFWWQGPNGTRILSTNFHYSEITIQVLENWEKFQIGRHLLKENGKKVWNYTIDYSELKEHVLDDICPHIGCFYGLSDGGHGPTHKEVATANEFAKHPMFKWSNIRNFFKDIEKNSEKFPVWNDELYLENHRGCFSNHANVKRYNRKYENLIISLEKLSVLISLLNSKFEYPIKKLEYLWKTTLKNQFHDILPGSSIPEVYDDVWDDWNEQDKIIQEIIDNIGAKLSGNQYSNSIQNVIEFYLFNPLSWERKSRVFIPVSLIKDKQVHEKDNKPNYAKLTILNSENSEHLCQPVTAELEDTTDRMPAGWWTVIKLNPLSITKAKLEILSDILTEEIEKNLSTPVSNYSISNQKLAIKVDPKSGALVELKVENINNGENLVKEQSSNLTYGFLDNEPISRHAWNLTPQYWEHPIELSNEEDVKIRISESGPIFNTLEISRALGISSIIQKLSLFKDSQEIFLEYLTDWKQKDIMLKILYSTSTNAQIATADGMYCAIQFKTNPDVPCDKARYEKICHKYFDVSTPDNEWGLALLNEGKYAFDVNGGDMRLTMLRACRYPSPAPEAWVNFERAENERLFNHKVPEYSGLGPFKCRYALLPHNGGALINSDGTPNVIVKRKAEEFNKPIMIIPTRNINENQENVLTSGKSLLEIMTPNVYLGTLKMNEWDKKETVIARFIESSGVPSTVEVKFNDKISQKVSTIKAIDLLEREIEYNFNWNQKSGILKFDIGRFEICTFELYL